MNPRPLIEIERSYSAAARRGVFGKMAFETEANAASMPDPGLGNRYRTSLVYSRELSSVEVACTIGGHNWTFGAAPAHMYHTVVGSIVDKKSKGTTATYT